MKVVKLEDVAKAAGVSRGTASNVFSRPEIVREEMREKVLAAARKLGYSGPDPRGRMLRAGKVNAIGIAGAWPLSYFFDDPFARVVLEGIGQVCDTHGAGMSLISALDERQVAWTIQSALVDGFILFCMDRGSHLVGLTRERRLPFVTLDFHSGDSQTPGLWIDDAEGARMAARHLVDLGHRDFAVLALPANDEAVGPVGVEHLAASIYTGTRERIRGYFDVLQGAGIDTGRVPIYETDNDEETTRAGMEHLFSEGRRPTAILAMSDRMALAALDWLAARGISVPGEVSIVGFDGVPEGAKSTPPLTTIAHSMLEMGRRAARMILDPSEEPTQEVVPLTLLTRATTAPPR
jgi:DNA-binding LacI/PurR family transcriptional regulator